jgi:3-deoxy-manno-octulosonate cytidylyltransferase (CMP-KDO synthetase)
VFIATDSPAVCNAARQWGAQTLLTDSAPRSGTERIATLLENLAGEFIINVQGDQPLIEPSLVDDLVQHWEVDPCDVITPVFRLNDPAAFADPNVVKVARARDGNALYFSRSPIPCLTDRAVAASEQQGTYWGHVGVYGYRRKALREYLSMPSGPLEEAEQLEQLRFLESGCRIRTFEITGSSLPVDTPADLERARTVLAKL